jgi:hypothetical protein
LNFGRVVAVTAAQALAPDVVPRTFEFHRELFKRLIFLVSPVGIEPTTY